LWPLPSLIIARSISLSTQVLLMEMEIINNEGRTDEALEIIDKVQRLPHAIPGDCTMYCLRASVLVNKVRTQRTESTLPAVRARGSVPIPTSD
jgi:hypothetical protein